MPLSQDELLAALRLAAERKATEAWRYYKPVAKHEEFFAKGVDYAERLLMAGNGCGKSESAAFEVSRHLTGEYPAGWNGFRFPSHKPVTCWIGGTSAKAVKEAAQTKLCGPPADPERFGSGMIPKAAFVGKPPASRSSVDAYESLAVRHVSGGISRVVFKSYEQSREDWQGADVDLLWFDEEPPLSIYTEGQARRRGAGRSLMTFTPLLGMSEVVRGFLNEENPNRIVVRMGLRDASWYSPERMEQMILQYPMHERQARIEGVPMLGAGAIFIIPRERLSIELQQVPMEWAKLWGIDFGIAHPFAAVLCAWNREDDVFYVLKTFKVEGQLPIVHTDAMLRMAAMDIPVAWPHDGNARDKGSGLTLAKQYKALGLAMMPTHASFPSGSISTEAAILEMQQRMADGRFRVNAACEDWWTEYSQYHRDDKGQIVKKYDDLLSATMKAIMMKRYGKSVAVGMGILDRRVLINRKRPLRAPPTDPWTNREIHTEEQPSGNYRNSGSPFRG